MPTPKTHSVARILRTAQDSFDLAPDSPEVADLLQRMSAARCPIVAEKTTASSYRIRALADDELREKRGKLVEAMTRAWASRGTR